MWLVLLLPVMVIAFVTMQLDLTPPDVGRSDWSATAQAMLGQQARAVVHVAANPGISGAVSVPVPVYALGGVNPFSTCAAADLVMTYEAAGGAYSRHDLTSLATALAGLQGGRVSSGLAAAGRLRAAPADYALPCAVPDGSVVVVSQVR